MNPVPSDNTKKYNCNRIGCWVGTWNMGVADPFSDEDGRLVGVKVSNSILQCLVPKGYQIYVIGIQEGASKNVYRAIDAYLNGTGEGPFTQLPFKTEDSAVYGFGDGAFSSQKFTGIAVFVSDAALVRIEILGCASYGFGLSSGSKGGVTFALRVDDMSTLAFVNCHLEANDDKLRLKQIQTLDKNLGIVLGSKLGLTSQSHHLIWMGDLNYRIHTLEPDEILRMLADGETEGLHRKYDGLQRDCKEGKGFHLFKEPEKPPTFYPSYKKVPNRGVVDTINDKDWPSSMYLTQYPVPVYKQVIKQKRFMFRNPGWTDRILYHSLSGVSSEIVPEEVVVNGVRRCNYNAVDNGPGMDISDHSPVFCTFYFYPNSKSYRSSMMEMHRQVIQLADQKKLHTDESHRSMRDL